MESATTATTHLADQQPPPTIAAIKLSAKTKALVEWKEVWLTDSCQNPAYCALHHPPSGQPLEFITRIESFTWPIFAPLYVYLQNMHLQGNTTQDIAHKPLTHMIANAVKHHYRQWNMSSHNALFTTRPKKPSSNLST
jgi:hypothetical protein